MRDFNRSGTFAGMCRLSLAALTVLAGCTSPEGQAWQKENEKYASAGQTSSDDGETTAVSGSTITTGDGADGSTSGTAGTTSIWNFQPFS